MITYSIDNLTAEDSCPLFYRYPTQINAQPAYVQMDEEGDITTGYNTEIGNGATPDVWYKCTLRWNVAPEIKGESLATLLESDEANELFLAVWNGHSIEHKNGNRVGVLDEEASDASDEIQSLLDELSNHSSGDSANVWDVSEFLFSSNKLLDVWKSGPVAIAVAKIKADALSQDVYIDGNISKCLLEEAFRYVDEELEGLTADHLDELVRHKYLVQDLADKYAAEFLN